MNFFYTLQRNKRLAPQKLAEQICSDRTRFNYFDNDLSQSLEKKFIDDYKGMVMKCILLKYLEIYASYVSFTIRF